ncbi:MAG: hypothetical protein FJX52_01550 [Alphaproteobacteria bacterium]|nr:hypothetical protein [Alphaproteobacteria bacterium]
MTALSKLRVTFEIYPDSYQMLLDITQKYAMPDPSKALRCLLDFAATDGDWKAIFEQVRCRRCG